MSLRTSLLAGYIPFFKVQGCSECVAAKCVNKRQKIDNGQSLQVTAVLALLYFVLLYPVSVFKEHIAFIFLIKQSKKYA
jgi:hypothetical protein